MSKDFDHLTEKIKALVCPHCRARRDEQLTCQTPDCSVLNEVATLVNLPDPLVPDWRVREALGIINRDWQKPLTVRQISREVGLSTSRLQHLFKTETGQAISQYLIERRLRQAAGLLLRTSLTVSEICYHVGFNSPLHFDHLFARRYGVTPTAFRRRHI